MAHQPRANAVMENFFSSVKSEVADRFQSGGEAKMELFDLIGPLRCENVSHLVELPRTPLQLQRFKDSAADERAVRLSSACRQRRSRCGRRRHSQTCAAVREVNALGTTSVGTTLKPQHSFVDKLSCWIFVLVAGAFPLVLAWAQRLDVRHPHGEWLGDGGGLLIEYGFFAAGSLLVGTCLSIAAVVLYARAKVSRAFPTLSVVIYGMLCVLWVGVSIFSLYEDWRYGRLW
jgi:hypothetical protein